MNIQDAAIRDGNRQSIDGSISVVSAPSHARVISATERRIIDKALSILDRTIDQQPLLSGATAVKQFLRLKLGCLEHEVFMVLYLDARNCLVAHEELFRGSLTQTSVYPREVVKRCLWHNAAAVVIAHNHPTGTLEPSRADEMLTSTLKSSLHLVDVRLLDHIVVGRSGTIAFTELGLL